MNRVSVRTLFVFGRCLPRLHPRNRVVATLAERVAASEAAEGEPRADEWAALAEGVEGVLAAGGLEAALPAHERGEGEAIGVDAGDEGPGEEAGEGLARGSARIGHGSPIRSVEQRLQSIGERGGEGGDG